MPFTAESRAARSPRSPTVFLKAGLTGVLPSAHLPGSVKSWLLLKCDELLERQICERKAKIDNRIILLVKLPTSETAVIKMQLCTKFVSFGTSRSLYRQSN